MSLFQAATRWQKPLKIAISGVSGAGKTLSALYLAYGITGDWGKIAVIDSEHGSALLFAGSREVGQFLHCDITPPFSPARYIELIVEADKELEGNGVIIVDSLSHAWNGVGGVLDIKEHLTKTTSANSYTAWNDAGKEQSKLINALLAAECHVIVTMRSKIDYALVENEKGKFMPQKVGLAPIQRDDTEYEFDTMFEISRRHSAVVTKDRTFLDGWEGVITPELGTFMKEWVQGGLPLPRCEVCGKVIIGSKTKTAQEIVGGTKKTSGKSMCLKCFKEWQANAKTVSNGDSEQNAAGVQAGV
jgi:hypothetical protein